MFTASPIKTLNAILLNSRLGETFTLAFGGGAVFLDALNYITPLAAFIAAIFAVIAGFYTARLKKLEYRHRIIELTKDQTKDHAENQSAE